jgi:hypothetical protein
VFSTASPSSTARAVASHICTAARCPLSTHTDQSRHISRAATSVAAQETSIFPGGWSLRESIAAPPPGWPLLAYLKSGYGRRYGAGRVAVSGSAKKFCTARLHTTRGPGALSNCRRGYSLEPFFNHVLLTTTGPPPDSRRTREAWPIPFVPGLASFSAYCDYPARAFDKRGSSTSGGSRFSFWR